MKTSPHFPAGKPPAATFRSKVLPRLLLVIPFGLSAGLLWWSLTAIRPLVKQSEELTTRITKLSAQIEEMEFRRRALVRQDIVGRYSDAMGRHFTGQDDVAAWLDELREKAITLALDFTPRFAEAENQTVGRENLIQVPVVLEVRPAAGITSPRNAYQRMVEFTHFVSTHPKRAELVKFSLGGRGGSAAKAVFNLNLWGVAPKI